MAASSSSAVVVTAHLRRPQPQLCSPPSWTASIRAGGARASGRSASQCRRRGLRLHAQGESRGAGAGEDTAAALADFWAAKPWWCQPWSILLTGSGAVAAPWILFHRLWPSALVAVPVVLWWYLFLLAVPAAYSEAYREAAEEQMRARSASSSGSQQDSD